MWKVLSLTFLRSMFWCSLFIHSSVAAFAEQPSNLTCVEFDSQKHQSHIIGYGEGPNYDSAQANALADISRFFDSKVTVEGQIFETEKSVALTSSNRVESEFRLSGFEVLHQTECKGQTIIHVGLRKSKITDGINARAESRQTAIQTQLEILKAAPTPMNKSKMEQIFSASTKQASSDLSIWIAIGKLGAQFPALPRSFNEEYAKAMGVSSKRQNAVKLSLVAEDEVARNTASDIKTYLINRGYAFHASSASVNKDSPNVLTWSCHVDQGQAFPSGIPFNVSCHAESSDLAMTFASRGMAPLQGIEQAAAMLIRRAIKKGEPANAH